MELKSIEDYARAGLLSLDTEGEKKSGEEKFSRREIQAKCASSPCAGERAHSYKVIEEARYPDPDCPRCGHALVWSMPGRKCRRVTPSSC